MKYHYIELNHYKRFGLNGLAHFSMTITEAVQLIIGTNGSGKSSLMNELTPWPPNHTDFEKKGSKIIKLSHNGYHYILTSTFMPSQKHSFVRLGRNGEDDLEMNEGGTVTVQRDLCKHQFGIDEDVHDLALGLLKFTEMNASQRKEWFLRLCDTNYDYAIRVYNKLREKHRDAAGAIKEFKRTLVQESEKLIQSDEEERLQAEAKGLHECLAHLMEYRKPVEKDLDNLSVEQAQMDEQLTRVARSLHNLMSQAEGDTWSSEEVLDDLIASATDERSRCSALMEKHSADFLSNERKIEALRAAEAQTIESLYKDVTMLDGEVASLGKSLTVDTRVMQPARAQEAFQTVRTQLLEVFSAIPSNKDKLFSQQALTEQREKLSQLVVLKANVAEKLLAKEHRKKHMEMHKDKPDLTCPSCNHRFSLNYNETEYERLSKDILTDHKRLEEEIAPAIAKVEEYLKQCSEYSTLYRQYLQCVQSWPILGPYWAYLADQKVVLEEPSTGLHHLGLIERDLDLQVNIADLEATAQEKLKLINSLKDVGGADLNTLVEQNAQLQELLTEETHRLQLAINRLNKANADKQRLLTMEQLQQRITGFIQKKRAINKEQIETLRRIEFNHAIRQVQSELATREHLLSSANAQKQRVEYIQKQIADLLDNEAALGILVKQMSPTEGLIAEGLLGFIHSHVDQMNTFIRKIWSYPLVIQACKIEDDNSVDLDYRKFPLMVERASNTVGDVSKGSEGMKEIVNLAFRLISLQHLGLADSPLMLDEFAKTFDEAHRAQANLVIKALVEQHTFTQLFMVSHYEASYGALSNAEICVLNGLNITTPKLKNQINKHVVMH